MFIPYGTDAPLYHRPWVTGAVIITNLAVFIAGSPDELILRHDVLEPHAWVTSNFVHADPIHLVVNMIFIWTFGQIIEGKLGWWRFLLVYLGIGVSECSSSRLSPWRSASRALPWAPPPSSTD